MANNYTSASFVIPVKDAEVTRQRMKALEEWMHSQDDAALQSFGDKAAVVAKALAEQLEQGALGFAWDLEGGTQGGTLGLFHDETIDMEAAVTVAQLLLDLDDNDAVCSATWADTCSKPRVDEFGGGAVVFDRHRAEWQSTYTASEELRKRFGGTR